MPDRHVTIRVREETREMLKRAGKKGETYDAIIRRLLEECGKGSY